MPESWAEALARYIHAHSQGSVSAKTGEQVGWAFETLAGLAVQRSLQRA